MTKQKSILFIKFIPILILLAGLAAFFYFHLYDYINLKTLQQHRNFLVTWRTEHFILAAIMFITIYTTATAISMPNALLLTIFGGFLFGPIFGTLYVVISATTGASIIFLATQTAFHDLLQQKAKPWLKSMAKGFQKNTVIYLLFLRLVPIFPFWLINIVPALLGVRLRTFFITTLIGIIPGTLVYVLLGNGIGIILDQNKTPDLKIIFTPSILIPLIGLALLSLVPIIYKRIKHHG